jgi:hypothetical protein
MSVILIRTKVHLFTPATAPSSSSANRTKVDDRYLTYLKQEKLGGLYFAVDF